MAPNPITPEPEPATITGCDLRQRFGDHGRDADLIAEYEQAAHRLAQAAL